jgi:cytoskeletal protein RodZ
MEEIFTRLKQARESRNLSIADVASATNINPDFLAALEQGKTNILPQAYVRAFLREYALVVGLEPQRVMEEYEAATTKSEGPKSAHVEPRENVVAARAEPEPAPEVSQIPTRKSGAAAIAAVVSVLLLGTVLYWNFSRTPDQRVENLPDAKRDEAPEGGTAVPEQAAPRTTDSLRLRAQTTDTVWVQIIIDSRDSLDYILYPNSLRRWNAGKSFRLSVGRPQAIQFTLNDTEMGPLGTDGRVVRNVLIDKSTLDRLRQGDQR